MAVPRKTFRIEETADAHLVRRGDDMRAAPRSAETPPAESRHADAQAETSHADTRHADTRHAEIMQALGALRAAVALPASPSATETRETVVALQAAQLTRIAHELEAVLSSSADATQKILTAAEEIDQHANNLSAALKGKLEQGMAQDISDFVLRIFEACNFQDLTGQRITKVMAALKSIEHEDAGPVLAPPQSDTVQYLHGPRLDGDSGHLTQEDIDALFTGWTVPVS